MNEEDPLAQLRDIHMPDPVGIWPPAPGWWILLAVILIGIAFYAFMRIKQYRLNQYRRSAQKELAFVWQQLLVDKETSRYLVALNAILKRTALTAYPTLSVANLQGRPWLEFLDQTYPECNKNFSEGFGNALLAGPYQRRVKNANFNGLHKLCLEWILHHQPQLKVIQRIKPTNTLREANA